MKTYRFAKLFLVALLWNVCCERAFATSELTATYDARSLGMGSTGSAYLHNGASIYHNPAGLDGIGEYAGTFVLMPNAPSLTTPIDGPNTSVSSDRQVFPLIFMGGAYRVSDRIVLGFAIYPTAGYGSGYSGVPSFGGLDFRFGIVSAEAVPAISFRLSDRVALGLAYRVTAAYSTATQPIGGAEADISSFGVNPFGILAGLTWRATDDLTLALAYRSQVTTQTSGTLTVNGVDSDIESQLATPQAIRLGVAQHLFDRRLLLAADAGYYFFRTSNRQTFNMVTPPGGAPVTTIIPLNWNNVLSVGMGAEYTLPSGIPLRAGLFLSQSATAEDTALYVALPPSLIKQVSLGTGFNSGRWNFDFAASYAFASADDVVPTYPTPPNNPGDYSADTYTFSFSFTYQK